MTKIFYTVTCIVCLITFIRLSVAVPLGMVVEGRAI